MTDHARELARAIRDCEGLFLVVTGAGISLASGIPTFRGSDLGAVWKRDVTELGTVRYFDQEPEGSWRWYLERFEKVLGARPNPAHSALVDIERWRVARQAPFLVITQNIDGLHRAAGSTALVEVHGAADRVRCSAYGCRNGAPDGSLPRSQVDLSSFLAHPTRQNVPRCPECGELLRQHVLWFDELYSGHRDYQWPRVLDASDTAELVLFVGTSFSVGVTEQVLSQARERGTPVYNVDPAGRPMRGVALVKEPSEVLLPRTAAVLDADAHPTR
ncbi:MAG: RNA polymerase subunit sigma [Deltaproteobacteria bacterium]|nr:RNA polymerase subunit sigma [Deltaproteobacteria bacterium]